MYETSRRVAFVWKNKITVFFSCVYETCRRVALSIKIGKKLYLVHFFIEVFFHARVFGAWIL